MGRERGTRRAALDGMMAAVCGTEAANIIRRAFRMMELAEEEIEEACKRHPQCRTWVHDMGFLMCRPGDLADAFVGAVDVVYRSHCRELCDRLAAGADTRPATVAEVLLGLAGASLKAPPGRDVSTLHARCFLEVMGTPADEELAGILKDMAGQRESFPGQLDEMMGEIRRKLRQDWRKPGKG